MSPPAVSQPQATVAPIWARQRRGSPLFYPPLLAAAQALTAPMQQISQTFWEEPVALHCVGVFKDAQAELYLGSRLFSLAHPAFPEDESVSLRVQLSESGGQWLLESALGKSPLPHSEEPRLSGFTALEEAILSQWCQQLFNPLTQQLAQHPYLGNGVSSHSTSSSYGKPVDMVWLLQHANETEPSGFTHGWLVLSLPYGLLVPWCQSLMAHYTQAMVGHPSAEHKQTQPLDAVLATAGIPVVLGLGKGRVPLDALQLLEVGDVVTLEQSHPGELWVHLQGAEPSVVPLPISVTWPVSVLHHQQVSFSSLSSSFQESHAMTASVDKQQFWNQVHIDVHAEFTPVRLPLEELRQLSEGLVVDVGALAQNTIRLHVDGKTVAHGELVIVGDRFGVRIQQLASASETPTLAPAMSFVTPAPDTTKASMAPGSLSEGITTDQTLAAQVPATPDDDEEW